ncbi:hypothetical protein [Bacillus thuringiensis]|uniref:DUF5659 domain-containing protein n=1 Tax=Bacillus thuringiensis subsp. darmstadiensis TaxID=132264 RepID=A0A9X6G5J7_BACUD|nr:hypothetical protein [Bacillus thuringiensis]ADH06308.1 hypothetical protein BMB171_C1492 [Bacillus thuringiensis BMB171]ADH09520.1 hypothetical protein BMB171_C4712 [Bacillus thuringiensis BMB171]OTZ29039.1 hypothetical protein BK761_29335 [Bacillus thuringiensis serovar darmstadiensis]OTZ33794.1 hypothetical protein BK761_12555 [Bacillus thuringiensis serovar darmstadiensis]OTZ34064.1 hypothetical protein BK761_11360 [Bacillus thuringiensis serovar darmstadiensis]
MQKKKPLRNVYKKTLAIELIRLGHDLNHTMRNRKDERFQVYAFVETPELIRDMIEINKRNDETYAKLFKR